MNLLEDRRILITGGAAGIGAAISRRCLEQGAKVAVLSRTRPAPDTWPENWHWFQADVSCDAAATAAVHEAAATLGGLDVVINNAGISPYGEFESGSSATWKQVFELNVLGSLYVTQAALDELKQSQAADVVFVGSATTHRPPTPANGVYVASKAAVSMFAQALRAEVREDGIRVTVISPGAVDTNIAATVPDESLRESISAYLRDWGVSPDDIARQLLHLLCEPRHISLQEIQVVPYAVS